MGGPLLSRRDFIRRSVQLAVVGALVPSAFAQLLPALAPDAIGASGPGPLILRDAKTRTKRAATVGDLLGPAPRVLNAEWNFLPTFAYKVHKAKLQGSSSIRSYNTAQFAVQHPAEENMAILVYDGKCKHLGCPVGFDARLPASDDVPDYDRDGLRDGRILCPCHQGQYDIHDLATNVPGTPPPQPLNVVEFDVLDFPGDDVRDVPAARQALFAVQKLVQNKRRSAAGKGTYPLLDAAGSSFSTASFALRAPGWSMVAPPVGDP